MACFGRATENQQMTVYTSQAEAVVREIREQGRCFCRESYVQKKYQESASTFLLAYRWFAQQACALVAPPAGAELPYWVFPDRKSISLSQFVMTLSVPKENLLLFDLHQWTRILQLDFLGASSEEERAFEQEMKECGLSPYVVMTTPFYPKWRQRILDSWDKLFLPYSRLLHAGPAPGETLQGAVWEIRREWIVALHDPEGREISFV